MPHPHLVAKVGTRPRPPTIDSSFDDRVPLSPRKVQKRESMGALRFLFGRNRSERALDSMVPTTLREDFVLTPSYETHTPGRAPITGREPVKAKFTSPTNDQVGHTPMARPISRMYRSSKSKGDSSTNSTASSPAAAPLPPPPPASSTNIKQPHRIPSRMSTTWDPPPLFQAYPQAIRHSKMSIPAASTESIMKRSKAKKVTAVDQDGTRQELNNNGDSKELLGIASKKSDQAKVKHRRQFSDGKSITEWTEKMFVLVTSGHLLQYDGEGSFDRLPEKILQLGKDSVAFASDVIPGRHWVLQVSQDTDTEVQTAVEGRSLFSRLTSRTIDSRRLVSTALLVFDSAEEMDEWMTSIRREVNFLGGRRYSEIRPADPMESTMALRSRRSQRSLVHRDPLLSPSHSNPSSPRLDSQWPQRPDSLSQTATGSSGGVADAARSSSTSRPSEDEQSVTTTATSQAGRRLSNLRNDSHRLSYVSSGQRTLETSRTSSPQCSPIEDSFGTNAEFPLPEAIGDIKPQPIAITTNDRRRSMHTTRTPRHDPSQANKTSRTHSVYWELGSNAASPRSATPNFSIPISPNVVRARSSQTSLSSTIRASSIIVTNDRHLSFVSDDALQWRLAKRDTEQVPSKVKLEEPGEAITLDSAAHHDEARTFPASLGKPQHTLVQAHDADSEQSPAAATSSHVSHPDEIPPLTFSQPEVISFTPPPPSPFPQGRIPPPPPPPPPPETSLPAIPQSKSRKPRVRRSSNSADAQLPPPLPPPQRPSSADLKLPLASARPTPTTTVRRPVSMQVLGSSSPRASLSFYPSIHPPPGRKKTAATAASTTTPTTSATTATITVPAPTPRRSSPHGASSPIIESPVREGHRCGSSCSSSTSSPPSAPRFLSVVSPPATATTATTTTTMTTTTTTTTTPPPSSSALISPSASTPLLLTMATAGGGTQSPKRSSVLSATSSSSSSAERRSRPPSASGRWHGHPTLVAGPPPRTPPLLSADAAAVVERLMGGSGGGTGNGSSTAAQQPTKQPVTMTTKQQQQQPQQPQQAASGRRRSMPQLPGAATAAAAAAARLGLMGPPPRPPPMGALPPLPAPKRAPRASDEREGTKQREQERDRAPRTEVLV